MEWDMRLWSLIFLVNCVATLSATETKKDLSTEIQVDILQSFSLHPQIQSMQGYDFRSRRITVKPGMSIPQHSHASRPGIVYVESGTIVEHREGKSRILSSGDTLIEDAVTTHGFKNMSDKPCVLIAFDLLQVK